MNVRAIHASMVHAMIDLTTTIAAALAVGREHDATMVGNYI